MRAFDRQARHQARQDFHLVLVHEQDTAKGACPFRTFFEQTPVELQKKYRLYDTLAVPLYPSAEHRKVSLRYALRNMGAMTAQSHEGLCARATKLSASVKQTLPKSVKLTSLMFWRREPLVNRLELDEEGHLALTDRSRVISREAASKDQSMTTLRFHFEKRTSARRSASDLPRASIERKEDLESRSI